MVLDPLVLVEDDVDLGEGASRSSAAATRHHSSSISRRAGEARLGLAASALCDEAVEQLVRHDPGHARQRRRGALAASSW